MTYITPMDLADMKISLRRNIQEGNKAAAIGDLYQFSLNAGVYIEQQKDHLPKDTIRELCGQVLGYAKDIKALTGDMDKDDLFVWNEALEDMELSFADRDPASLTELKKLNQNTQIQAAPALALQLT